MLFIFALLLAAAAVSAQEEKNAESLPPGMEKIKVGRGSEVVVPQGTKTHKVGDLVVLEQPQEYVARKVTEQDARIAKIEGENRALVLKMERLEAQLAEMHNLLLKAKPENK